MTLKLFGCVLIFVYMRIHTYECVLNNIAVKAYCHKDDAAFTARMVIFANGDALSLVYGMTSSGSTLNVRCSSLTEIGNPSEFTGDGSNNNPLMISMSINPTSLLSTPDCHRTLDIAQKTFTWTFRVMDSGVTAPASAGLPAISFGDFTDYTFSCNFATLSSSPKVASYSILDNQASRNPIIENADLLVVNPSDPSQVLTSVTEGMTVRLKAVMTTISNGAIGLSPFKCYQCGTAGCPSNLPRVELTGDNGCPTSVFVNEAGALADGFKGTDPTSLVTGAFQVGAWAGQNFVIFHCKLDFCYTGDNMAICTDRCAYYRQLQTGRKKRSMVEMGNYTNLVARSHQSVQSLLHVGDESVAQYENSKPLLPYEDLWSKPVNPEHPRCLKSVFFLATINILSVLSVVSVVVAVIAWLKYRKITHID